MADAKTKQKMKDIDTLRWRTWNGRERLLSDHDVVSLTDLRARYRDSATTFAFFPLAFAVLLAESVTSYAWGLPEGGEALLNLALFGAFTVLVTWFWRQGERDVTDAVVEREKINLCYQQAAEKIDREYQEKTAPLRRLLGGDVGPLGEADGWRDDADETYH